jgi:hypothetical protein
LEPFRIICETCGARLKVRSEQVIGEIHACPKCDSMVQIVPPAGWSAVAAGTSLDSVDFPSAPETLAAVYEPRVVEFSANDLMATPSEAFVPAEPALPVPASSAPWLLWGVSGAALLVVGGAVAAFWPGRGVTAVEPAVPKEPAAIAIDEPPAEAVTEAAPVAEPTADAEESVETPAAVESADSSSENLPAEVRASTTAATPAAEPEAPRLPPPVEVAEPAETGQHVPSKNPRPPVMKLDPLDFDPSEWTPGPHAITNVALAAGSIPASAESVDDATAGGPAAAPEVAASQPKIDPSLNLQLGPMPARAPRPHGQTAQLSLRVKSFDVAGMPLHEFVRVMAEAAGVPITIDPLALELSGISPHQPVTVKAADSTIERLLSDVLGKNRLAIVETDGHALLVPASGDRKRGVDYDVADLVGDKGNEILLLIRRCVAPQSWQDGDGFVELVGPKLHVEHTQNIRHQVLIFCERLRLARGLALRSRYPAALLSAEPPYRRIEPKLNQKATFTFLPWRRLAEVVEHWQVASGITILVDWAALADIELGPSSPVACSATERTWAEILDGTLAPVGLAWWPVNGDTIQITTRSRVETIARVEFYAVPKESQEQFLASVEKDLRKRDDIKSDQAVIIADDVSGRLIVLGPPPVHRFLSERIK